MQVVVFIKMVPEVADADLKISKGGTEIDVEDLVMGINEWDNYAVEEAIRIKEAHGGNVTVATLGDEDSEDVLRRALAMGADEAILIDGEDFEGSDAPGIARGLCEAIKDIPFDLVLCGVQSADDGWAQVGLISAERLGLPFASLAVQVDIDGGRATVHRELEASTLEKVEISLPALITIQTGVNDPRYVSIMGIRKVRKVQIQETDAEGLELSGGQIGAAGSSVALRRLFLPPEGEGAQILTGSLPDICEKAAVIIRDKGGVA
jgi:electron transfer flavoprotein beta subunit